MQTMPKWVDVVLIPLILVGLAFGISALVILAIGGNPVEALMVMVSGALGTSYGWDYTLFFTTNFIFTGLCVAIAYHAGLFNIGGEGQATLGGLGVALALLYLPLGHWLPAMLAAILGAAAFGALWALIPAWLQARRGSHIVITTIMFNLIAASLLIWVVDRLRPVGTMDPASANFPPETRLPQLGNMLRAIGIDWAQDTPANIMLLVALAAAAAVWAILWRTRLGYKMRAFGRSEPAIRYAGISPTWIIVVTMLISGALAGMMAVNNTMGGHGRLILNATDQAGFIGIAVALMGRNHPVGVVLAALLFGFLYQGGLELALWTNIPRELITVIQALVVLFTGALDNMLRVPIGRYFARRARARLPGTEG